MIKVLKKNCVIALCETPRWVCLRENGYFNVCEAEEAEGIAVNDTVYNLQGYDIGAQDTVVCVEVDGGEHIMEQQENLDELILTVLEG